VIIFVLISGMALGNCPPDRFYSEVNVVSKLDEEAKLAWKM